ncbi:hypothetical protein WDU94_007010 [Cyamophila willieti]
MENPASRHLTSLHSEESNHSALSQSAHTKLYQGETQAIINNDSQPINTSNAHTKLNQESQDPINTTKPLNGSPPGADVILKSENYPKNMPVNGTPVNGSLPAVLSGSSDPVSVSDISCSAVPSSTSSKQHGCDRNKPCVSNGKVSSGAGRKSSLTLSLSRRGSGFVSPIGDTIINRPSGPGRKKSHVQFEPPQPDSPSTEPTPVPAGSGGDSSPPPQPPPSASNGTSRCS